MIITKTDNLLIKDYVYKITIYVINAVSFFSIISSIRLFGN